MEIEVFVIREYWLEQLLEYDAETFDAIENGRLGEYDAVQLAMSLPSPKGRRCTPSPGGMKPGPLKATLPVASLVKAESEIAKCKSNSPTTALHNRYSPDGSYSGQRSPGSLSFRGYKTKGGSSSVGSPIACSIRRTASMDAIYLKGKWPSEAFFMHLGILQVDKATQTDDSWNGKTDASCEDGKLDKYLRHRLRTGRLQGLGLRLISPPCGPDQSPTPPNEAVTGPWIVSSPSRGSYGPLRPPMRGSLEGLNQEIERLVLKDFDDKTVGCGSIPEGHRAPLLELLRPTRSVNTQTPGSNGDEPDLDWGSSGPPSRGSMSPHFYMDLIGHPSRNESCGSSPDEAGRAGSSPHINRFLAREPPDGCERVSLKMEESRKGSVPPLQPLKPISMFKPSLGSAFHPLQTPADPQLLNGGCSESEPEGASPAPSD